ncbi:hypothetical protein VOLCADRAFT_104335 [Volvox carteri f. nagariensis]|uniref:WH2 domain-containing protein n=1 Tax=Volvox carteri f. nagariensis TaxID=3068 RepID=D8TT00_VOLCA|nr:uncharacterized protein VOLCADRAFT_104335 [Volvox carteri f. nagariensis]EFJ49468.1 hypothetical protein VOLCADRAFT_104335 [Volvox carteri f. nagariensis]|eukprot:XP_002949449.1 hypothetical protein VOLCADRAFT_104335 [Volvox carteri f. nagariensis]
MSLDNVLYELRHEGADKKLKHVEDVADRSQPAIEPGTHVHNWDKDSFLKEIETGVALKHVKESQDRSSPRVEGIQVHPNDRPSFLAEVKAVGGHHALISELKAGGVALQHVESPADRSAPAVQGAQVGKWDKDAFLHEIESPHTLKHVENAADRSGPRVEPDLQIKSNKHDDLLNEIKSTSPTQLRHLRAFCREVCSRQIHLVQGPFNRAK